MRWSACGCTHERPAAAAGIRRRYWVYLVFSVVLMACVGAAHGMIALLVGPIFDRVLNPASVGTRVLLFTDPVFHHPFYLDQIVPGIAPEAQHLDHGGVRHPGRIPDQGPVRLPGELPGELRRAFGGHGPAQHGVRQSACKQGAQFFEAHSTGRLMSSIMNDIEKIQVAVSHILADLLRQIFMVLGAAVRDPG